ncbi:MAG: DUF2250 domain-containing protein [candidate division Zixibacteria bacterium]|nr:DUF2250 domain-containing protein [candidate division Zixibacteria bacterium]
MAKEIKLKDEYVQARCCSPRPDEKIIGYYSHNNVLKVHRHDCPSLKATDQERLVNLQWEDILQPSGFQPDDIYDSLDRIDFAIMEHHLQMGIDYSLVVARAVGISKTEAFGRHRKLRDLSLLERVEPKIVQYRKGIAANKWIKHRNHTYYGLTSKGDDFIRFYLDHQAD